MIGQGQRQGAACGPGALAGAGEVAEGEQRLTPGQLGLDPHDEAPRARGQVLDDVQGAGGDLQGGAGVVLAEVAELGGELLRALHRRRVGAVGVGAGQPSEPLGGAAGALDPQRRVARGQPHTQQGRVVDDTAGLGLTQAHRGHPARE
ncbi:hypothetical protein [Arsenicicoccus sp. oral taxon 190]|uniref:hypothetical protein n=1 Tax=Arsenicicoccus sp. oral taxon 190 TaxID=1658671 RepID=UPI000679F514|nr:hypothetical protein [Arsenicicoccus sp. oral taxon 190]AKT52246.1 hypothetical protein ADJ73_14955 [Arsenicicoccus sp. oral taxon 190]